MYPRILITPKACISSMRKPCISPIPQELYIIIAKHRYTLARDDIQARRASLMIYAALRASMIYHCFAMDKKNDLSKQVDFFGRGSRVLLCGVMCCNDYTFCAACVFHLRITQDTAFAVCGTAMTSSRCCSPGFPIKQKYRPQGSVFLFGGGSWIRTSEVSDNRFTVCPLWPLGNSPIKYGAGERSRTINLLITNQLLCH